MRSLTVFLLSVSLAGLLFVPSSESLMRPNEAAERARVAAIWTMPRPECSQPVNEDWVNRVSQIKWVAYSSPNPNPNGGFYRPTAEIVFQDLLILKKAGFTGLVTYGSSGIMGREFLSIAESLGYEGVIMGIWEPRSELEFKNATNASSLPIVTGYYIGNEGLDGPRDRYSIEELCSAIANLRAATGKPVTTSEEVDDYYRHAQLLNVGDWIFPNAHPYWHFTKYPLAAARWETDQYQRLTESAQRFVLFKEVGLPTDGALGLSELNHDLYYRALAKTDVRYVAFEGFDQPSKTHSSVEPYWGIFQSTRKPKLLGWNLMGYRTFSSNNLYDGWIIERSPESGLGGSVETSSPLLLVGDDALNQEYRAFLSFNTAGLPDNAVVTSVRLKVRSAGMVGGELFNLNRKLKADICAGFFGSSLKLKADDFQSKKDCLIAGEFSIRQGNGWFTAILNANAFSRINLKGTTQFRLRFNRGDNGDFGADYIRFFSGNAADLNQPVLLVRYYVP